MKIPFKPSLMKTRYRKPRWIIIHHTSEIYDIPSSRIDNGKYQLPGVLKGVLEKKQADINYHYIIEKIDDDYQVLAGRPFVYICEWDDIPFNINENSIHIACLGSYDFKIPEPRLYEVLAYRLINPLIRVFHTLRPEKILLHNEVSTNEKITCPGEFFDKAILISMVKRFIIK